MFSECSSLTYLPDISIWNTSNLININNIFNKTSIISLPDISKWNISKFKHKINIYNNNMTSGSFTSLSDFSKFLVSNMSLKNIKNSKKKSSNNSSSNSLKKSQNVETKNYYSIENTTEDVGGVSEYYENFYAEN